MFSRRSRYTDVIHQLLSAHFADIPQILTSYKALAVAVSLQLDLPQETMVNRTEISLRQLQRIEHNIIFHVSIQKPKIIQQNWKSKITHEMEEVRALLDGIAEKAI